MEAVASNYLRGGDITSAANLYTSLEHLNPKHQRMARLCRVLADPTGVPVPHRHNDICEAILNPFIPADILLAGGNPSFESVQKQFQRLAVHVHPDKNPNTKASEAFQRLTVMKDEALHILDLQRAKAALKSQQAAAAAAVVAAEGGISGAKRGKRKGAAVGDSKGHLQQQQQQQESPVIPNLDALKQTRITLKSLKRKDIDASFEIFRSARRPQHDIDGDGSEEGNASAVEQQLASTAPSRFVAPRDVKPPPKKAGGSKGRPLGPRRGKGVPSSRRTAEVEGGLSTAADSNFDGSRVSSAGSAAAVRGGSAPSGAIPSLGSLGYNGGSLDANDTVAAEDSDERQAMRNQVDTIIADLAQIKAQRTGIRLSCDLSFEAYQREKGKTA